jgi:hypothetical protein
MGGGGGSRRCERRGCGAGGARVRRERRERRERRVRREWREYGTRGFYPPDNRL